jgi:hypothetical protein
MYIRGEALEGVTTLSFTISGQRGNWTVTVTAPGNIKTEDTTCERSWDKLFREMTTAAFKTANRRRGFPDRTAVAVDGAKP